MGFPRVNQTPHSIYPTRSATWNLDRAKAPGIVDLKSPHIVNMGRLKIDDPRELIAQVQIQVHDRVGYIIKKYKNATRRSKNS